jgi:hypothetical protein
LRSAPSRCAAARQSGREHLQSTGIYIVRPDGAGLRATHAEDGFPVHPMSDGKRLLFYETDDRRMAKNATWIELPRSTWQQAIASTTASREISFHRPGFRTAASAVVRATDETGGLSLESTSGAR